MRTRRLQSESGYYHVVARGTGRQLIFEDDDDRLRLVSVLRVSAATYGCSIIAWCLMGNHFHLLIHAPLESMSLFMRQVCGGYAQWFNLRHQRTGHLFQGRFKSQPIDGDAYFLQAVRYIHLNPSAAGIAAFDDYRWSSFGEYRGTADAIRLADTALPLKMIGGEEALVRFHRAADGDGFFIDADEPRSATRAMGDGRAQGIAAQVLGDLAPSDLKALGKPARNEYLARLRGAGLSVRQIERLTGIGRGVIQTAKPDKCDKL